MTKKLFLGAFLAINTFSFGQTTLLSENFNDITTLWTSGWSQTNQSTAVGLIPAYIQGVPGNFVAYSSPDDSYIGGHYNNEANNGTISNWLVTPVLSLNNGDVVSFYTRTAGGYADNLELRLSTAGASTVMPSGGPSGLGSFTNLVLTVNTTFPTVSGYPTTWTQYSYTVSGLSGATDCKVGFRYYVPNGGPNGANSNFIGIDNFLVTSTLSSDSFFKNNFALYPNPVSDMLNVQSNLIIEEISVLDINGRKVKNSVSNSISVSNLESGVYLIEVKSKEGIGTSKFVKN